MLNLSVAAADTTAKVTTTIASKLASMSDMSMQQLVEVATKGIITVAIKIVIALAIFLVGRWIIRRVKSALRRFMERRDVDLSLRSFLISMVNISMMIFLILIIVGVLGIDTSSFIALFASAGLAIGLALSGTLQNFAGGVIVLFIKPFRVGDFIEADGQTGTVKEIQLFHTVLSTPDNKIIMLPNGGVAAGIINNYSREDHRRVDWTFGIAYGDNYDTAKKVIEAMLAADARVQTDPAPFVALHSLGASSVNIVVRAWVGTSDYWSVYFDMNERVYKEFGNHGLNIPFPQMDVHMHTHGGK